MKDEEVGELWKDWHDVEGDSAWEEAGPICDLIRKLVYERANWLEDKRGTRDLPGLDQALRDFNIDPETWKDSKKD